jgi:uncharacterized membrane protein HdeD (DUF308 family)
MRAATLEKLIWVLIFGGMLLLTLGLFMHRGGGDELAWVVMLVGALAVLVGVVLVFVRARMNAGSAAPRDP